MGSFFIRSRTLGATVGVLVTLALTAGPAFGASSIKTVLFGKFTAPVALSQVPGSAADIWVVQKNGQIAVARNGVMQPTKALNITGSVSYGAEQGLLGLAFAPDFASSKLVYVTYTDKANALVLAEYQESSGVLDPNSRRVVLTITKKYLDHNAGTIHFGADGFLYMAVGDGGTGPTGAAADPDNNSQNLGSLLGKILRINPKQSGSMAYTVPTDNPFVLTAGARPEVWQYGLRNPWKWSFAPDGAIWIGDVGLETHEEVDRATVPGMNFGWRIFEGPRLRDASAGAPGLTAPVSSYKHSSAAGCAITGGYVVTDKALPSAIRGKYIYTDFCVAKLMLVSLSSKGKATVSSTGLTIPGGMPTSIDTDTAGRLYVSTLGGSIYRIAKR